MRTQLSRKSVSFPPWHFYINSDQPPSEHMMYTLKSCRRWELLRPEEPFGPVDIPGSLNGLLNRELIGVRKVIIRNDSYFTWFVTERGKTLLKQIA